MKKENKKMAQEARKAQREKEMRKAKLKKFAPAIVVVVIVVVLVAAFAINSKSDQTESSDVSTTSVSSEVTVDSTAEESDAMELDTTAGVAVQDGDQINLDYTGYLGDEAFEGGSTGGNGTDLTIGSGMYIDGFEEQIIGHTVGETFDITVTFPEDYGAADLAGQEARFEITVNGIYH